MISLPSLRDAAFWGHSLCLECSATFDSSLDLCPACGSTRLMPSEDALQLTTLLDLDPGRDLEGWPEESPE